MIELFDSNGKVYMTGEKDDALYFLDICLDLLSQGIHLYIRWNEYL